jgi:aspartate aminotransferase
VISRQLLRMRESLGSYVLPGSVFEMPGFFRISLTANDDMVERAIPGFAGAIEEVRG